MTIAESVARRYRGHPDRAAGRHSDTVDKVARRVLAARPDAILAQTRGELLKMKAWASSFRSTLSDAKADSADAPRGHVWQDHWVDFWAPFDPIQRRLYKLEGSLSRENRDLADESDGFFEPPKAARIDEAISHPKFAKRQGKDHIAYSEKKLVEWHKAFSWWVDYAIRSVESLLKN